MGAIGPHFLLCKYKEYKKSRYLCYMKMIKHDGQYFMDAREIHSSLGIRTQYSTWIKSAIKNAEIEDGKDFYSQNYESTGGRPSIGHILTRDAALAVIMMSGGSFAGKLRKQVIDLFKKHETGLAFTAEQVESLIDISKAVTLVSIQKDVEKRHFDIYNNKYDWHRYRAAVLGYSTEDVVKAMQAVNKKHKTIRASLLALDSNELIRVGVIDFMIAMGKTVEYATNCGDLCKSIASKMKLGSIIWDDTKDNPIGLNRESIQGRIGLYEQKRIGA